MPEAKPKRSSVTLRDLEQAANVALFNLHDYLRVHDEEQWRAIYGARCDVGRIGGYIREQWIDMERAEQYELARRQEEEANGKS